MFLNIEPIPNKPMRFYYYLFIVLLLYCNSLWANSIKVVDDGGHNIELSKPAERVISLSPGLTELLFSSGAGNQVKGVVSYSDYPPAAKRLPLVGSYNSLDMERIIALQPDLIFAWQSGNPEAQVQQLKKMGFTVFISEAHQLEEIPDIILKMGLLTGNQEQAQQQANHFKHDLQRLKNNYANKPKVSVFAQIWNKPVMSIGGNHLISRLVELCAGENIFRSYDSLTITPDIESVIEKRPQVILSTGMAKQGEAWLRRWQNWKAIPAVQHQQLYSINPDLLVRHTLRVLQGAEQLCQFFDQARQHYQLFQSSQ